MGSLGSGTGVANCAGERGGLAVFRQLAHHTPEVAITAAHPRRKCPTMSVVVLSSDLATGSQIHAAAKQAGAPCATALGPGSLMEKATGARLVLIDLTMPQLDVAETVQAL